MPQIRAAGRAVGVALTASAIDGAIAAAEAAAARSGVLILRFTLDATGELVPLPTLTSEATHAAIERVRARGHDVGARAGEDAGAAAAKQSLALALDDNPIAASSAAEQVGKIFARRATTGSDRVISTEITAGDSIGMAAAIDDLRARGLPKLRKVWDATLDMRVCPTCKLIHQTVIDADDKWLGYIDEAPAHAFCRCSVLVWCDDWTDLLHDLGIAPGPRTGVLESAEEHQSSFADHQGITNAGEAAAAGARIPTTPKAVEYWSKRAGRVRF